jgi:tetratricopeptide (TPR) repeat protein
MIRKPALACILATLVLMIAAPAFPGEDPFDTAAAAKHLEQGFDFLKAKKYDAAVKEFEEAASINPDAEAYYYLGYTYYLKGRKGDEESREKSRENFAEAYEIDPDFSPIRNKHAEPAPSDDVTQKEGSADAQTPPAQQESPQTQPTTPAAPQTQR